ncbi:MAG: hypothetical protein MJZ15_09610 [Bacteroidales bacterium]|nr:hypothetical protein [Bacteroidales bacterium]
METIKKVYETPSWEEVSFDKNVSVMMVSDPPVLPWLKGGNKSAGAEEEKDANELDQSFDYNPF